MKMRLRLKVNLWVNLLMKPKKIIKKHPQGRISMMKQLQSHSTANQSQSQLNTGHTSTGQWEPCAWPSSDPATVHSARTLILTQWPGSQPFATKGSPKESLTATALSMRQRLGRITSRDETLSSMRLCVTIRPSAQSTSSIP